MKINCEFHNDAFRKGGGLILGFILHYPIALCDEVDSGFTQYGYRRLVSVRIGLLVVSIDIDFYYEHNQ
jgi:hypothetical protein